MMAERLNTTVCNFDPASRKITAFDIHEWIHNTLRIPEQNVTMIQIDGIKRQVFIKLINNDCVQSMLKDINGEAKYKHQGEEVSTVGIAVAGLGIKRVRVANLPRDWRRWKMNPHMMEDEEITLHIRHEYERWKK